jgi:hypothetical protein
MLSKRERPAPPTPPSRRGRCPPSRAQRRAEATSAAAGERGTLFGSRAGVGVCARCSYSAGWPGPGRGEWRRMGWGRSSGRKGESQVPSGAGERVSVLPKVLASLQEPWRTPPGCGCLGWSQRLTGMEWLIWRCRCRAPPPGARCGSFSYSARRTHPEELSLDQPHPSQVLCKSYCF